MNINVSIRCKILYSFIQTAFFSMGQAASNPLVDSDDSSGENSENKSIKGNSTKEDNFSTRKSLPSIHEIRDLYLYYKDECFDFCLDTEDTKLLLTNFTFISSKELYKKFDITNAGLIYVMEVFAGLMAIATNGKVVEKLRFYFSMFDLNNANALTYDEVVILFGSVLTGIVKILNKGNFPEDIAMERLADQAYIESDKDLGDLLNFDDIANWLCKFLNIESEELSCSEVLVAFDLLEEPNTLPDAFVTASFNQPHDLEKYIQNIDLKDVASAGNTCLSNGPNTMAVNPIYYSNNIPLNIGNGLVTNTEDIPNPTLSSHTCLSLCQVHGSTPHRYTNTLLCFPPTGEIIYAAGTKVILGKVKRTVNKESNISQRFYHRHTAELSCLALHPFLPVVASGEIGTSQPAIHIWNIYNLSTLCVIKGNTCSSLEKEQKGDRGIGPKSGVACVAFNLDGNQLAVAGKDSLTTLLIYKWNNDIFDSSANENMFYKNPLLIRQTFVMTPILDMLFINQKNTLMTVGKGIVNFWENHEKSSSSLIRVKGSFGNRAIKQYIMSCVLFNDLVYTATAGGQVYVWPTTPIKITNRSGKEELSYICEGGPTLHDGPTISLCTIKGNDPRDPGYLVTCGHDGYVKILDSYLQTKQTFNIRKKAPHLLPQSYLIRQVRCWGAVDLEENKKSDSIVLSKCVVATQAGDIVEMYASGQSLIYTSSHSSVATSKTSMELPISIDSFPNRTLNPLCASFVTALNQELHLWAFNSENVTSGCRKLETFFLPHYQSPNSILSTGNNGQEVNKNRNLYAHMHIATVKYSPDGFTLAIGLSTTRENIRGDNVSTVLLLSTESPIRIDGYVDNCTVNVTSLHFSPDGGLLLIGLQNGNVEAYSIAGIETTFKWVYRLSDTLRSSSLHVDFTLDGALVKLGTSLYNLNILDTSTGMIPNDSGKSDKAIYNWSKSNFPTNQEDIARLLAGFDSVDNGATSISINQMSNQEMFITQKSISGVTRSFAFATLPLPETASNGKSRAPLYDWYEGHLSGSAIKGSFLSSLSPSPDGASHQVTFLITAGNLDGMIMIWKLQKYGYTMDLSVQKELAYENNLPASALPILRQPFSLSNSSNHPFESFCFSSKNHISGFSELEKKRLNELIYPPQYKSGHISELPPSGKNAKDNISTNIVSSKKKPICRIKYRWEDSVHAPSRFSDPILYDLPSQSLHTLWIHGYEGAKVKSNLYHDYADRLVYSVGRQIVILDVKSSEIPAQMHLCQGHIQENGYDQDLLAMALTPCRRYLAVSITRSPIITIYDLRKVNTKASTSNVYFTKLDTNAGCILMMDFFQHQRSDQHYVNLLACICYNPTNCVFSLLICDWVSGFRIDCKEIGYELPTGCSWLNAGQIIVTGRNSVTVWKSSTTAKYTLDISKCDDYNDVLETDAMVPVKGVFGRKVELAPITAVSSFLPEKYGKLMFDSSGTTIAFEEAKSKGDNEDSELALDEDGKIIPFCCGTFITGHMDGSIYMWKDGKVEQAVTGLMVDPVSCVCITLNMFEKIDAETDELLFIPNEEVSIHVGSTNGNIKCLNSRLEILFTVCANPDLNLADAEGTQDLSSSTSVENSCVTNIAPYINGGGIRYGTIDGDIREWFPTAANNPYIDLTEETSFENSMSTDDRKLYKSSLLVSTHQHQRYQDNNASTITALAANPKRAQYATGGSDGRLCLWCFKTRMLLVVKELGENIGSITFSPDGSNLVVGFGRKGSSSKKPIRTENIDNVPGVFLVLDCNDLSEIYRSTSTQNHGPITCANYTDDGTTLAIACTNSLIIFFDAQDNFLEQGVCKGSGEFNFIDFTTDAKYMSTSTVDTKELQYFSVSTCKRLKLGSPQLRDAQWHSHTCLYTWATQGCIRMIENKSIGGDTEVTAVNRSPDRTLIVSADNKGAIHTHFYPCPDTSALFDTLTLHRGAIKNIVWSFDGKYLVSCGKDDGMIAQYEIIGTPYEKPSNLDIKPKKNAAKEQLAEAQLNQMNPTYTNDLMYCSNYALQENNKFSVPLHVTQNPSLFKEEVLPEYPEPPVLPLGSERPPEGHRLHLEHVYGYSSSKIGVLASGEIVFGASNVAVIMTREKENKMQRFYRGHANKITAISVHRDGWTVATADSLYCGIGGTLNEEDASKNIASKTVKTSDLSSSSTIASFEGHNIQNNDFNARAGLGSGGASNVMLNQDFGKSEDQNDEQWLSGSNHSSGPQIRIWDSRSMNTLMIISGFLTHGISHVMFDPTGLYLLAVGLDDDHTIALYDWRDSDGNSTSVSSSITYDKNSRLAQGRKKFDTFQSPFSKPGLLAVSDTTKEAIADVAISAYGEVVVAVSKSMLRCWSNGLDSGHRFHPNLGRNITSAGYNCVEIIQSTPSRVEKGSLLICIGTKDGAIIIINKELELIKSLRLHPAPVLALCSFSPSLSELPLLVSTGGDGSAIIVSLENFQSIDSLDVSPYLDLESTLYSNVPRENISGNPEKSHEDEEEGKKKEKLSTCCQLSKFLISYPLSISNVSVTSDNDIILGLARGKIVQWNRGRADDSTLSVLTEGHIYPLCITGLATHPSHHEFATCSLDGDLIVWDSATHTRKTSLNLGGIPLTAIAYNANGDYIAVGCGGDKEDGEQRAGCFYVYSINEEDDGRCFLTLVHEELIFACGDAVSTIGFSPDGNYFCCGSVDSQIHVYECKRGFNKKTSCTTGHTKPITHLDFSVDGKYMMSCAGRLELCFWVVSSGKQVRNRDQALKQVKWYSWTSVVGWEIANVRSHDAFPYRLSVDRSRDGKLIALTQSPGTILLYQHPFINKVAAALRYNGHCSSISHLRWTVGDQHLISVGESDGCIFQWSHQQVRVPISLATSMEETYDPDIACVSSQAFDRSLLMDQVNEIGGLWKPKIVRNIPLLSPEEEDNDEEDEDDAFTSMGSLNTAQEKARPWRASLAPPSNYADTANLIEKSPEIFRDAPVENLELQWVYGYDGVNSRHNLVYDKVGQLIYSVGKVVVLLSPDGRHQRYFKGHTDRVTALAISSCGRYVASAQCGKLARIFVWRTDILSEVAAFCNVVSNGVNALAFPQSTSISNADSIGLLAVMGYCPTYAKGFSSSSEKQQVAILSWKSSPCVLATGVNDKGTGLCMAFSNTINDEPDNMIENTSYESSHTLAIGSTNEFSLFTMDGSTSLRRVPGIWGKIYKVQPIMSCVGLENGLWATGMLDGSVYFWQGNRTIGCIPISEPNPSSESPYTPITCINRFGDMIITGSSNGSIKLWREGMDILEIADQKTFNLASVTGEITNKGASTIASSPDSGLGSEEQIGAMANDKINQQYIKSGIFSTPIRIKAIAVSMACEKIAVGTDRGDVYDIHISCHSDNVLASEDLVIENDKDVESNSALTSVLDSTSNSPVNMFCTVRVHGHSPSGTDATKINSGIKSPLCAMAYHPIKPFFVTGAGDGIIRVWDVVKKNCINHRKLSINAPITAINYHPEGSYLAVGLQKLKKKKRNNVDDTDGMKNNTGQFQPIPASSTIALFMSSSLDTLFVDDRAEATITDIKFSNDGSTLIAACMDKCIYIYEWIASKRTYNYRCTCQGHSGGVTHIDITTDGRYLRSNSTSFELFFWNVARGSLMKHGATDLKDYNWLTNSCPFSWPLQGIWPDIHDGIEVLSSSVLLDNLAAVGDDHGRLRLYNYPILDADVASFKVYQMASDLVTSVNWCNYIVSTGRNNIGFTNNSNIGESLGVSGIVLGVVGGSESCIFEYKLNGLSVEKLTNLQE